MTEVSHKDASRLMLRPGAAASSRHTSDQQLTTDAEETVIAAGLTARQYIIDIWKYRELLLFLAWREILVRYKQTVVGIAWAIIRPALMIFVLVIVFDKLGKMPSGGVPYPLLV